MYPPIFCDERMNSIALKGIQDLVVACVVGTCRNGIPWAWGGLLQCSVLADSLKAASAPLGVFIALQVGDSGRVIQQLVATDAREANEVRQVPLKNLKRVLERYQDVRI
jgi:hypothetical protein